MLFLLVFASIYSFVFTYLSIIFLDIYFDFAKYSRTQPFYSRSFHAFQLFIPSLYFHKYNWIGTYDLLFYSYIVCVFNWACL